MSTDILAGIQWGDEGKGKIIDVLTENIDIVVRFQGGNNAGHTVKIGNETHVLHLIPSGIFRSQSKCIIGNGVVVNPLILHKEMNELTAKSINLENRLEISSRSHLIFQHHCLMDALKEKERNSNNKIGTTKRGIGPAYADKVSRRGIRAVEMLDLQRFERRFKEEAESYNKFFESYGHEKVNIEDEWKKLKETATFLAPYIKDTVLSLNEAVQSGKNILFEGAQGMFLDVDYGTYPYVTSSNTTSGAACTGSGLSPKYIDTIYGVMKAYCTRVGEGPFPTELFNEEGENIRKAGNEYGATTGRPRRCGWFDAVAGKYSCLVNGIDKLAITKLDVLDKMDVIKVCIGYEINGKIYRNMPADTDLVSQAEPQYQIFEGWKESTSNAKSFSELPKKTQEYLNSISQLVGADLGIISVGPKREQTFWLS